MVTADNITDEQIRELRAGTWGDSDGTFHDLCTVALGLPCPRPHPATGITHPTRAEARARCAEIWNARQNGGTK